jgi:hypothetical protein
MIALFFSWAFSLQSTTQVSSPILHLLEVCCVNSKTQSDQQKSFSKILQNARVCNSLRLKKFTEVGYCVSFFKILPHLDSLPMDSMPIL